MATVQSINPSSERAAAQEIRNLADKISTRVYELQNIVTLAAFACEARRVLEGIEGIAKYQPEVRKLVLSRVEASAMWEEMTDVAGEVLAQAGKDLARLNNDISTRFYAVASVVEGETPNA